MNISPHDHDEDSKNTELYNSPPLHYFNKYLTEQSLNHADKTEMGTLFILIYANTHKSPLIFASDGSHSQQTRQTSTASSVLIAVNDATTGKRWQDDPVELIQA